MDNCVEDINSAQTDSDGDGAGDACDECPYDADDDIDDDGTCGDTDNCETTANPEQTDSDGDGTGDACDTCPLDPDDDVDGDGLCGDTDNCDLTVNPDQADGDGDGLGDACDDCAADAANDADGDGVCGDTDNCEATANADQNDRDGDGVGDACDACPADADNDSDGDGACGDVDNCPVNANADQSDRNGNGLGDVCDLTGLCTITQGGWGAVAEGNNPGTWRDAHFASVYPTGLVVGGTYTATFTTPAAIEAYLPAGGSPKMLNRNYVNPLTTVSGVLGGQVVALALNVGFSDAGYFPQENAVPLGDVHIASGLFEDLSVSELLDLANAVLGGDRNALRPYGAGTGDLNTTVTLVNQSFDNCDPSNNTILEQ